MERIQALQGRAIDAPKPAARRHRVRLTSAVSLAAMIVAGGGGCTTHTLRIVDTTPPEQLGSVIDESRLLDVGVAVFDSNVPETFDEQVAANVTPEVRRAEANYMAYFTKNLLQSTGNWGAVRVVPRQTHAVDVTLSGTIVHSDGERVILRAIVRDARGHQWFDNTYEALASKYAYGDAIPPDIDPFQSIYRRLADDMLGYLKTLSARDVYAIRTTAEMKFAREFSPDAFGNYVAESRSGVFKVLRLPAEEDPMLGRVRKVREREYVFIDTLDEYFEDFHARMYPAYRNWRQATYSEAIAYRNERQKARRRAVAGVVGIAAGAIAQTSDTRTTRYGGTVSVISGASMIHTAIQNFANARVHGEVLRELGVSAEAEIAPHTIELENRTLSLQGTVAAQYEQLRAVLKRLYHQEFGLPLAEDAPATDAASAADLDEQPDDAI